MSRSQEFRKIVPCVGMEMAALMGAPLRPDELTDLFRSKQQAGIESSVRKVCARRIADNGGLLS